MPDVEALPAKALCTQCDASDFRFETTAELEDMAEVVGLDRVAEAVRFGTEIDREGYNLFALGPPGVGKHSAIQHFIVEKAARQPAPSDWCYTNNFEDPRKPKLLRLPAGLGSRLGADVQKLVEDLRSAIPSAFDSEEYRTRKQIIEEEVAERRDEAMEGLRKEAENRGLGLLRTPVGLAFAPVRDGNVMSPERFQKLPVEERQQYEQDIQALQQQLQPILRLIPRWEKEIRDKLRQLNREVALFAVGHLIDELREAYRESPGVIEYLEAFQADVVDNFQLFLKPPESPPTAGLGIPRHPLLEGSPFFRRYIINVLIDHREDQGAPVVYEDHPTYQNLVGEIEHTVTMAASVTDFTLIKPGALHRANGGYLVLDARKVLLQPYAWEGLKRILRSGEIRIESLGQALSLISSVSLEPEPVPLKVKVVLIGDRLLYYLLSSLDPDFSELFKVAVDFEEQIDRGPENNQLYARMIATMARSQKLLPLDRGAVARILEQSARSIGDAEKLSIHKGDITDLLSESDYWARQASRDLIRAEDVQRAIDAQIRRADRVRERMQEEIERGNILIDTEGEQIGQVNGLSVISLGNFRFGRPNRITARVRLGKGEVIDIEREVELGGPIHSKGVLILSGFLGARYALDRPLSLSATLVFEQSYGGVEGDSASSAELYSLLSALAGVPIRQSLAVTGSVNQHGKVQAIGGVNEKIEGFFDICQARGLTEEQGVLIPASNVKNLMLRRDVVAAAQTGKFHVYPIETVNQGIEVLTGMVAGERDKNGRFPDSTFNALVEKRLVDLADRMSNHGKGGRKS